jgi:RHS repeat-associated protein
MVYDISGMLVAEYGQAESDGGGLRYIFQDQQGSTRAVLDAQGQVQARRDYAPFGEDVGAAGTRAGVAGYNSADETRQQYAQTERDKETGLNHTQWRKYDSAAGRWTSPDPYNGSMNAGDPQSFNRYAYVSNDPVNFVDPSGLNASGCSAEFSYSQCGGDDGFWSGNFGNGVAIFNDVFGGMPEHTGEFLARHLVSVNPRALSRFLPENAYYIGDMNWAYWWEKSDGTLVAEIITFSYERLRTMTFQRGQFGWSSGRLFRDVYGGLYEPGIEKDPHTPLDFTGAGGLGKRVLSAGITSGIKGITWKSVKAFGHTFSKHGQGAKITRRLIGRAAKTGDNQGQWLDNEAAAAFLQTIGPVSGPTSVRLPAGLGHVITPDGNIVPAAHALIIPFPNGGIRTAFPIIPE